MADKEDDFQDVPVSEDAAAAQVEETAPDSQPTDNGPSETVPLKQEVIAVDDQALSNDEAESKSQEASNAPTSSIRPQRTLSARTLKIVSTEERKGRVAKHTVYIIECDPPPPGVITVARRYNDFKWLRSALCAQFPALFVPPLPPANIVGRFENSFISERRQDLERFLNRVEAVHPFSESLSFQMFLSRPETTLLEGRKEVESAMANVISDEAEMFAVLRRLFPDLGDAAQENESNAEAEAAAETEMTELKAFLVSIEAQMGVLSKSALRLFKHLNFVSKEMLTFTGAFDGLYTAESNYPYKASAERLDVREQFSVWAEFQTKQTDEYYDNFFRSLRYEHEDVRALLELFKYYEGIEKRYRKVCGSIAKWDEMEANGADLKESQQKQRGIDRENRKKLKSLVDLVTQIILKNEMIGVWNAKTTAWQEKIQRFTKIQSEITNKMILNWKDLAVADGDE